MSVPDCTAGRKIGLGLVRGPQLAHPGQDSLNRRMVSIKKLGYGMQGFAFLPAIPHQCFVSLGVINPWSLLHLQHPPLYR
jgi:hypothetical protein